MDLANRARAPDFEPRAARFANDGEWFHGIVAAMSRSEAISGKGTGILIGAVR